jgi:subtilisin-like proprotein convertase family protein
MPPVGSPRIARCRRAGRSSKTRRSVSLGAAKVEQLVVFTSTQVPRSIPDNNATGVRSNIVVTPTGLDIQRVTVDANITHTFRGDLVIQVIAPNGQVATLSNRAGGSADNFVATGTDITGSFTTGSAASGTWQLFVRDLARIDVGTINSFSLHITSTN